VWTILKSRRRVVQAQGDPWEEIRDGKVFGHLMSPYSDKYRDIIAESCRDSLSEGLLSKISFPELVITPAPNAPPSSCAVVVLRFVVSLSVETVGVVARPSSIFLCR
jgi:hypothetical protein